MKRIANASELRSELTALLTYAQSERPSRFRLARSLQDLSERVAAEKIEIGESITLSKDIYGHTHDGFRKGQSVRVTGRNRSSVGTTMYDLRTRSGVVVTVSEDDL